MMSLFSKKYKGNNNSNSELFYEIAKMISGDEAVADSLKYCCTSPKGYFREHEKEYSMRSMDVTDHDDDIRWIGIADALISQGCLCELDYKEELTDFVAAIKGIAKKKNIRIDDEWMNALCQYENEEITVWCNLLDDKLKNASLCLAAMDIDSDSYVIFISPIKDLKILQELSDKVNKRIDFAKNM